MSFDQIVVGAGVVGAAAARSLTGAGASVLLLEAFHRGHDRGSSHGGTRIFRHGYTEPDYVGLTIRARDGWRQLESVSGKSILESTGAIDHGDVQMVAAIEAALIDAGLSAERLSAEQAACRWPGLRFETDVIFSASGGRLRADIAVDALLEAAERAGAELRFDSPVTDVDVTDAGVTVTVGEERFDASGVVVAAGSWTPALIGGWLAAQGAPLPVLRVSEEQPAHFPKLGEEGRDSGSEWPSFIHHFPAAPGERAAPSVYGLYAPGEGVKVGVHGAGPTIDPSHRDRTIDPGRLAALRAYVSDWIPGVDSASPVPISCIYDNTDNEDFILDRVGPVTVATGFSGHGFKFGPVLGEILADLALHAIPAPSRFRLR